LNFFFQIKESLLISLSFFRQKILEAWETATGSSISQETKTSTSTSGDDDSGEDEVEKSAEE